MNVPTATGTARPIRSANTAAVIEVLRASGPCSQAAIARATGLAPATVSSIVHELREAGAAEIRAVNGRQSEVSLVITDGLVISVEIADGWIRGAVFAPADKVRRDRSVAESHPRALVGLVQELLADAPADRTLVGVALSIQSPLEHCTATIPVWVTGRIPQWRDVRIGEGLPIADDVPVVVDNDANLAALAEWLWGSGRGEGNFLYLRSAEGVGGGLVVDGAIFHGSNGQAGVLGHMVVDPSGAVCYCGSRGCLTTKVSETAIRAALPQSRSSWSLREIIAAAEQGDPACRRVLAEAGRSLGRAVANTARVVAPSAIAIGGVLGASPVVQAAINSSPEVTNLAVVSPQTSLVPARLGEEAAVLGGLAVVLDRVGAGMSQLPDWARHDQD